MSETTQPKTAQADSKKTKVKAEEPPRHQFTFETAGVDWLGHALDEAAGDASSHFLDPAPSAFLRQQTSVVTKADARPTSQAAPARPAFRGRDFAAVPAQAASHPVIQPKLTVGAADDQYEQEADLVAEQVMTMSAPAQPAGTTVQRDKDPEDELQTKPAVQRHTIPPGRQGVGSEDEEIQTKPLIQRAPSFERMNEEGMIAGVRARSLWGNGALPTVQRKNGDKAPKDVNIKDAPKAKAEAKAEDPAVKQAKEEYQKYVAGGPYTYENYVPDTAENFGKFDATYNPGSKLLTLDMRVKFVFPDMSVPKGKLAPIIEKTQKETQKTYIATFIQHVTTGWSGKYAFKNIREPQSVWGKLNPIRAKVNVQSVESKQHYTFNKYFKNLAGKIPNVASNTTGQVSMYVFDTIKQGFTGNASVGQGEVVRLRRNLPKTHFANGSADIDAKYIPDLQFVADYLRRMSRPKFEIEVVGHANKTGKESVNLKYSALRAQAVKDKLRAFGVTNHKLTSRGVGSAGATADGSWRKVDFVITTDKSFSNVQDVDMHEFGHMLGLDDEYYRGAGDTRSNTTQHKMKVMQKMLGSEAYGKGQEDKYADEVTKIYATEASAGIMHAGNEVRVYNYVTFWQALSDTAAKGASQPADAFTWKDWKIIG